MTRKNTNVREELIKVMANIAITDHAHAEKFRDRDDSVGTIAYERFLFLLEAMKPDRFVGFQWTPGDRCIPDLQVFSNDTAVHPDTVRWAFPANGVEPLEKANEVAMEFSKDRYMYFFDRPTTQEELDQDECDFIEIAYSDEETLLPNVSMKEVYREIAAERAILRITAFPCKDKNPGLLLMVSTPRPISLRLRSVLSIFFRHGRIRDFDELKNMNSEEKEATLIPSTFLRREIGVMLYRSMVIPQTEEEREEELACMPIESLHLSVRAYNVLKRAGVSTLSELVNLSDDDLWEMRNMSQSCVREIHKVLDSLRKKGVLPKCRVLALPDKPAPVAAMEELDNLIGLSGIKMQAKKIIAFARMQKDIQARHLSTSPIVMNMEFTGNPGTAKTTVARIMSRLFHEVGLLKFSEVIEVGRADLVGEYTGHTAVKVKEVFSRARGRVLFIDEAYSLLDRWTNSYGDEAINTIVQEMENNRENTIVIFAGYPDKMAEFMRRNPGLRSRVPFHLSFPDYTEEELLAITEKTAEGRGFRISKSAEGRIIELCREACGNGENGNGRFCRNLVENAIMNYAMRVYGNGDVSCQETPVPEESHPKTKKADSPEAPDEEVRLHLLSEDFSLPEMAKEEEETTLKKPIGF